MYSIGIDYGTQSCRAILVNNSNGVEVGIAEAPYPHGVMETVMPDGATRLEHDFALQHPMDYLDVLKQVCSEVLSKTGIDAGEVTGVGVDFTACTILPIDSNGDPLCFQETFSSNPHAYVKLWKHHAAQSHADRINVLAEEREEAFLKNYGGKISSEWLLPKLMEILEKAPDVYDEADRFIEAGDWIVLQLTGEEKRSSCMAGYKGTWHKKEGYPTKDFLGALHPKLETVVEDKLSEDIYPVGSKAGNINLKGHELTGLAEGTAVAVPIIDAHSALPASGIAEEGKMLMIMGTSTCHLMLGKEENAVPGISGLVEDGILPGFIAYEAGQACVGDHFGWFVKNCVPKSYYEACEEKGIGIHELLTEKAKQLEVGESGLLALDWWNGNRSVLVDADLTGMILGCTLTTRPEEIYRALIEATAFGTRKIIETFIQGGIPVNELYAAGGISVKNPMMMQIYSDVTGMPIRICDSTQAVALGSAIFGAVAAGEKAGGYDTIYEAVEQMSKVKDEFFEPDMENHKLYTEIYREYEQLHDYFGRENNVMKRLKSIKKNGKH